jgi:hypothetical protein
MELEELILVVVEGTPADQTEIGQKLLILAAPDGFPLAPAIAFERNVADGSLACGAIPEMRITGAENRAQDAIAGCVGFQVTESQTAAMCAAGLGENESVGSCPFHMSFQGPSWRFFTRWVYPDSVLSRCYFRGTIRQPADNKKLWYSE